LYPLKDMNALNTVGYKELFSYLDGTDTLDHACEKIKQHTRNFAKRQLTWWKRDPSIHWISVDKQDAFGDALAQIERDQ
jgi:tRNA dimethylallyltransferase